MTTKDESECFAGRCNCCVCRGRHCLTNHRGHDHKQAWQEPDPTLTPSGSDLVTLDALIAQLRHAAAHESVEFVARLHRHAVDALTATRAEIARLQQERDTALRKARYCCATGERTMAEVCCLETLEARVSQL